MEKKVFEVVFDREKCKGCELCISVCPKKILALDSKVNEKGYHPAGITAQEDCVGCQSCAIMCPDCAISIYVAEEVTA